MAWAKNKEQKRSNTPQKSLFQSAPAHIMAPRLMVILSTIALVVLGVVMVYSSSSITAYVEQGSATSEVIKQAAFAIGGLILATLIVVYVKCDFIRGMGGLIFWGICMLLLVVTAIMGTVGLGAKRWLIVGGVGIQISEFAKITFVIMAARIAEDYQEGAIDLWESFKQATVYILVPLVFLFVTQSDFGTTLICCVGIFAVLVLSGVSKRILFGVIIAGIAIGIIGVLAASYRSDRLFSFMDPWSDEQDTGYQLVHSFKAFAAGGLFGTGIGNSYEKLLYLPEAETDFIFAIIGEELGLVGCAAVIAAFLVFLRGSYLVASRATTPFNALLTAGLATMLVFQAFLNIACVVGLLPTTGKPLPFISSGGSSMISSLMLVGIIIAVSFDSHNEGEYRQRRENLHVVSSVQARNPRASRR